jgi:hypothetical protein
MIIRRTHKKQQSLITLLSRNNNQTTTTTTKTNNNNNNIQQQTSLLVVNNKLKSELQHTQIQEPCYSTQTFNSLYKIEVTGYDERIPAYLVEFVRVFLTSCGGLDKPWPRYSKSWGKDNQQNQFIQSIQALDSGESVTMAIHDSNIAALLIKQLVQRLQLLTQLPMEMVLEGFFSHKIHQRLTVSRMLTYLGEPQISSLLFLIDFLVLISDSPACMISDKELAHAFSGLLWVPQIVTSMDDICLAYKEISAILMNMIKYSRETRKSLNDRLLVLL